MQITATSVDTVRLHLSGSSALINSLRPDQVKAKLDLSDAVNGPNVFTLSARNINLPPGLQINRIEPPEVQVSLDIPLHKSLAVQVNWVGALPSELILESATVTPDKISVVGAQRELDQISTLYTEKVNLSELRTSGQLTARLAIDPSVMKVADGSRREVTVSYSIGRRPGSKSEGS